MTAGLLRRLVGVTSGAELLAALVVVVSYPLMLLTALLPATGAFAVVAALSYLGDHYLHRSGSYLLVRMGKARVGLTVRFLVRQLLLVLLLARTGWTDETVAQVAVVGLLAFYALQVPHTALVTVLRRKRRLPFATRNIDLSTMPVPDGAPRWLTHRAVEKVLHAEVPMFAGLLAMVLTEETLPGYVGTVAAPALVLLYLLALLPYLRAAKLPPDPEGALEWFDGWLREHRPETALYFSGSKESVYQADMWLETMERLDSKPLVILRERAILNRLATTTVPVVCVPSAVHLMNMDLSMLRVGLYPANVGKNLHLLRVPTMKHVFIGHGDSDKIASINPYAKAYDEVWSAGRAGRDRYALADVGVRDEDIVEVGRPQLASILPASARPEGRVPTVLYAPTWEGWTDDPGNTSLLLAGENIVRKLLTAERPVRVIYKPHPFTGTRNPAAGAAHQRIVALIEEAAAARAADPRWAAEAERTAADRATAQATLRAVEQAGGGSAAKLATVWDDASVSRDAQTPADQAAVEERAFAEWNEAFWRSFGWWEHRVITGSQPRLFDCFNESDALVSDISSVVSDWIASGKPYAVSDSAELGADEFRRQNTAVRAAVILSNDAAQLDELLDAVTSPGADALAQDRVELKHYLLGPDEPTSLERFNAAVNALAARAEARNQALGEAGTAAVVSTS
ncbi:hypothetical protein SAMN06297387_117109 [Streptomyces zhaozhouensis]|uniref:CDP-Glycerol:Poly(Glycerophosphate) glycerophosphotransferase n=1 Tax=Streptomyces zhaozhouensis TaxID=1300267 RepID=A0A286E0W2_9ACTN|nr:hypothetical protein [Streptomyces zhaozhouensis]SOD64542.1 hypothetical protein SAMN06297387_117109 [Streptomyces zhaozhouensis]